MLQLLTRGTTADVARVATDLPTLRARAASELGEGDALVTAIDEMLSGWLLANGDVAGATAIDDRLRKPVPNPNGRRVAGRVVDTSGRPVAGAVVSADAELRGDSATAGRGTSGSMRVVRTDDDGRFEIADAMSPGEIVAQHGALRSVAHRVAGDVTLVVEPTTRLTGSVALHGPWTSHTVSVRVRGHEPDYQVVASLARDGTWTVDGIPRRLVEVDVFQIRAMRLRGHATVVDASRPVAPLHVDLEQPRRKVRAVLRSTTSQPIKSAMVIALPAGVTIRKARDADRLTGFLDGSFAAELDAKAPAELRAAGKSGDAYAIVDAPVGAATLCAIALPNELGDLGAVFQHPLFQDVDLACVPAPPDAGVLTIKVAPLPRIE